MNRMWKKRGAEVLLMSALGIVFSASCTPTVPTDDNGNGNVDPFSPSGVTFGGFQPPREDVEARPQAINPFAASASAELPSSADLTKDLPPVGNQGGLASCTAWAAGYAAASYTANRQFGWGADTSEHQASAGYLYELLLEADNFDCGSGTLISTAMNLLIQGGCSSLATVPYTDDACVTGPSASDAANFQIGSFNRVVETDRYAIRSELAAGRIIVFGARLFNDFPDFTGSSVYTGSGEFLTQGSQHAAHAMALVGYDDSRGAYRVMNSWSTDWGDAGYMWMSYETFENTAFEAYAIEATGDREPPNPQPGPGPEPDNNVEGDPNGFIDDAFQFADVDAVTREQLVYLVFFYHFDAPVFIRSVTVTDPNGDSGQQIYNTWYLDGYVYFVQTGGFQWQAGTYTLDFDTQTEAGNDVLYQAVADIAPLGEDGVDGGLCSNLCMFSYDGECDDGGSGADYFLCDYGTDCADCGVRDDTVVDDGDLCFDTCRFAQDGECDDGGEGADFFLCDYGTDCSDCGPRSQDDIIVTEFCVDACPFAFDGECDDGGIGATTDVCDFGTDCFDCGVRTEDDFIDFDDSFAPKVSGRKFRGVTIETPGETLNWPGAGVHGHVLGANRQPVRVTPAQKRARVEETNGQ